MLPRRMPQISFCERLERAIGGQLRAKASKSKWDIPLEGERDDGFSSFESRASFIMPLVADLIFEALLSRKGSCYL
jgi:hypothetical protein